MHMQQKLYLLLGVIVFSISLYVISLGKNNISFSLYDDAAKASMFVSLMFFSSVIIMYVKRDRQSDFYKFGSLLGKIALFLIAFFVACLIFSFVVVWLWGLSGDN